VELALALAVPVLVDVVAVLVLVVELLELLGTAAPPRYQLAGSSPRH
jgi:hypothetical protein